MSRINLCTNPSFENNTTDWNVYSGEATIARSTVRAQVGAASGLVTWAADSNGTNQVYSRFDTIVGKQYTLSIWVYVPAGSTPIHLNFRSANANSTVTNAWQRLSVTATAASTTEALVIAPTTGSGGVAYIDAALFEQSPLTGPYFDGNTATASWTGAAGNSTSVYIGAQALTVANDLTNVPPRQILFVSNSPGSTITITRTDPDGNIRAVRTAENAPLVGGQWSGYDYESPFDPAGIAQLTYTAAPSDGSTPFTATVAALPVTQSWLIHPGVPDLSQPVTILDGDPGETFDSGATAHDVLGRSTPVIVTDGVRRSAASSFIIATDTVVQRKAMEALLADTSPLLLQAIVTGPEVSELFPSLTLFPSPTLFPSSGTGGGAFTTYDWLAIDQVTRDRASGYVVDPWRRWTLPYRVVDRPAGGVAAQRTWADLMTDAATWSDVIRRFATWNGALTGSPGS